MEEVSANTRGMNEPEKDSPVPFRPSGSDLATEVYYRFLRRHLAIFDFLSFTVEVAATADQTRLAIARARAALKDEYVPLLDEAERNKNQAMSMLTKFGNYISETMCISIADNFLCFLSESIQHCMLKNPNLLKSNEMVRIEDILKFSRRSKIVQFLVDRKINEVSYGGVADISNFLDSRTGIKLVEFDEELDLLTIAVELRNIYTHNRGFVNERFARKVGRAMRFVQAKEGKRLHADFELIVLLSNNLFQIAQRLDGRIAKKFRIRRKRYELY